MLRPFRSCRPGLCVVRPVLYSGQWTSYISVSRMRSSRAHQPPLKQSSAASQAARYSKPTVWELQRIRRHYCTFDQPSSPLHSVSEGSTGRGTQTASRPWRSDLDCAVRVLESGGPRSYYVCRMGEFFLLHAIRAQSFSLEILESKSGETSLCCEDHEDGAKNCVYADHRCMPHSRLERLTFASNIVRVRRSTTELAGLTHLQNLHIQYGPSFTNAYC